MPATAPARRLGAAGAVSEPRPSIDNRRAGFLLGVIALSPARGADLWCGESRASDASRAHLIERNGIMAFAMTEMLGCEFPLFAFSHCRDVVVAVSRAGGFGVLGGAAFTPEQLETELAWIDAHVDGKPYGVDILVPEHLAVNPDELGAQKVM